MQLRFLIWLQLSACWVTEIGTAATGFFFNELDVETCFPGGVPPSEHPDKVFWI